VKLTSLASISSIRAWNHWKERVLGRRDLSRRVPWPELSLELREVTFYLGRTRAGPFGEELCDEEVELGGEAGGWGHDEVWEEWLDGSRGHLVVGSMGFHVLSADEVLRESFLPTASAQLQGRRSTERVYIRSHPTLHSLHPKVDTQGWGGPWEDTYHILSDTWGTYKPGVREPFIRTGKIWQVGCIIGRSLVLKYFVLCNAMQCLLG
jgi:hypothetical protein